MQLTWNRTACRTLESAKKLSEGVKLSTPISLDVTDDKALDAAVAQHDLVISLIPYTFHATVIKSAIRNKKNVVTTSYVSPAMMELDAEAKAAGITVMNEIGLDPVSSRCRSAFLPHRAYCCEINMANHDLIGYRPSVRRQDHQRGPQRRWQDHRVQELLRWSASR